MRGRRVEGPPHCAAWGKLLLEEVQRHLLSARRAEYADLRVISEDRGLVWIDDVRVIPLPSVFVLP